MIFRSQYNSMRFSRLPLLVFSSSQLLEL